MGDDRLARGLAALVVLAGVAGLIGIVPPPPQATWPLITGASFYLFGRAVLKRNGK